MRFRSKQPKDFPLGTERTTHDRDRMTPFPANLAHAIAWGASLEAVGYEWPPTADNSSDSDTVEETTMEQ